MSIFTFLNGRGLPRTAIAFSSFLFITNLGPSLIKATLLSSRTAAVYSDSFIFLATMTLLVSVFIEKFSFRRQNMVNDFTPNLRGVF